MNILIANQFGAIEGGPSRYALELYALLKGHGHEVAFFAMNKQSIKIPTSGEFPQAGGAETGTQRAAGQERATNESAENMVTSEIQERWSKYWIDPVETKREKASLADSIRTILNFFWSFEASKKFGALISDFKPDVIHLNSIHHHLSPSIISAATRARVPVVMTVHDYSLIYPDYALKNHQLSSCHRRSFLPFLFDQKSGWPFLSRVLLYLEFTFHRVIRAYSKINAFAVPSEFLRSLMENAGFLNAYHLPNFYSAEIEPRKVAESTQESTIVCFGRLAYGKGVEELLESYRRVRGELGSGVPRLVFIGNGPLKEKLESMVSTYMLNDSVLFEDFTGVEPLDAYRRATFVVAPSYPGFENFPYSVLNACALGKPILSSGLGGLSEMIQDRVTGWNVLRSLEVVSRQTFVDRLTLVLKRAVTTPPEQLAQMGERAREYANTLTPESHYEYLVKLYRSIG